MCVSACVCENVSLVEVSFTYSMNRQCKGMKETELLEVKRKLADALDEVDNVLTLLEVPVDNWQLDSESKHASRKRTDTAAAGGKKKLFTTAFADHIRSLAFMSVTCRDVFCLGRVQTQQRRGTLTTWRAASVTIPSLLS